MYAFSHDGYLKCINITIIYSTNIEKMLVISKNGNCFHIRKIFDLSNPPLLPLKMFIIILFEEPYISRTHQLVKQSSNPV